MELNEAGVILRLLLKKLREEKAILDTDAAFVRRFENREAS